VEGGLHVLVNNAAVQVAKPLAEVNLDDWEQTMAVNLRAPWLLAQALLPQLKQAGGAVVQVASIHALQTSPELGAYAASKGGLMALTRSMAIEYAPEVRVNAVLPGAVDTEMLRAGLERGGQTREKLESKVLLKRIADPAEIARAIYFLADSEQSSYITGQGLVVDGGATARLSIE
jgi:NAD(P)-dependent dehydrogenase (short-subunit alcohol dehydrogenase family)